MWTCGILVCKKKIYLCRRYRQKYAHLGKEDKEEAEEEIRKKEKNLTDNMVYGMLD